MVNYCAILGVWFPGCPLFRGNFVLESAVGSVTYIRIYVRTTVRVRVIRAPASYTHVSLPSQFIISRTTQS